MFAVSLLRKIRRFSRNVQGGIALIFALALPPVALCAVIGVEMGQVVSDRLKTQDAADAAALDGARQLAMSAEGVEGRTEALALSKLDGVMRHAQVTPEVSVVGRDTLKVVIRTHRDSFFGNMVPKGGFFTRVEAIAKAEGQVPLCVLVFGSGGGDKIDLQQASRMTAPACLVHSNQDIRVASGQLSALAVETGATAKGPISPAADVGAPDIADPFASVKISVPSCGLSAISIEIISSDKTLPAGVHCGILMIQNGAVVTLAPGDHYFAGDLTLLDTSRLAGDDVVLVFRKGSKFDFKDQSLVSLNGRKSGGLSGFVVVATRDNNATFMIESDHVTNLLGTVYIPNARLQVTGSAKIAQSSAWTVITALGLTLQGNKNGAPQLVINANYAASDVPVPIGVGATRAKSRLVR